MPCDHKCHKCDRPRYYFLSWNTHTLQFAIDSVHLCDKSEAEIKNHIMTRFSSEQIKWIEQPFKDKAKTETENTGVIV
jgi:hypothetical protein